MLDGLFSSVLLSAFCIWVATPPEFKGVQTEACAAAARRASASNAAKTSRLTSNGDGEAEFTYLTSHKAWGWIWSAACAYCCKRILQSITSRWRNWVKPPTTSPAASTRLD